MYKLKPLLIISLFSLLFSSCFLINKTDQKKPLPAETQKAEAPSLSESENTVSGKTSRAPASAEPPIQVQAEHSNQKKVRFIAVGDTGTGAEKQYEVARAMAEKCKKSGCDFALILGDNIYNNGVTSVNDPQFDSKFEKPYKDFNFKFYMTLGNHDYRGNVQAEVDYTAKSKKWVMPGRTYSINKGPLDIFSIDSNQPSEKQTKELTKGLENSKARWKLVFGHHPRYTNGIYKNQVRTDFAAMIDKALCGRADMYLCGHEHDKQHLKKVCGVDYLIVGTGAGIRKTGVGPNTLFARSSYGFSWFEVDEKTMHVQILDTAGKVEYEYSMKK
jgi:tartrate-resistant acid phosphatase type 5